MVISYLHGGCAPLARLSILSAAYTFMLMGRPWCSNGSIQPR
jgi:hypothetical protein